MEPTPVLARDVLVTVFRDDCSMGLAHIWDTPHYNAAFIYLMVLQYDKDPEYYEGVMTAYEYKKMKDMNDYFWAKYKEYVLNERICTVGPEFAQEASDNATVDFIAERYQSNIEEWLESGTQIPPVAYASDTHDGKYIILDGIDRFAFLCAHFTVLTGVKPDNFRVLLTIENMLMTGLNMTNRSRLINENKQYNMLNFTRPIIDARQYRPPDSGLDKTFPEPFFAVLGHGCLNGLTCPQNPQKRKAMSKIVPPGRTIVFLTLPGGVTYQEAMNSDELVTILRTKKMTPRYRRSYYVVFQEGEMYCDSDIYFYDPEGTGELQKYGVYKFADPGQTHALMPMYTPNKKIKNVMSVSEIIDIFRGTYVFYTCRTTEHSNVAKDARNFNLAAHRPGSLQARTLLQSERDPDGPRATAIRLGREHASARGIVRTAPIRANLLRRLSSIADPMIQ